MPTKKIAVILAGCGVFDGSEIHESTLTLLYLSEQGAEVQCFAPNINQAHVVNHVTQQEAAETRNVLVESARIARGNIKNITELNVDDFGALIIPGGFGAAKNLSDFAFKGADCTVNADVLAATQAFAKAEKPIGLICIAPHLAPKIYGRGIICTIGKDTNTAAEIEKMGAIHQDCTVDNIVEDKAHKLVTTPAYMLGRSIGDIAPGIRKLVLRVLQLTDFQ
ncbi:isoprenoid biosynthesis glyoxalase ElbB [Entomomonas asaccharolytica]|uniref:Glyoxalase n=1 Tax=Entomomonas asaccharolytica TaxID=2785331 RepID=A0A974RWJ3_9GAMM|nr:isoprenoid biosynthesis glyoxalase ElbB [Entomomonas asaccharolytica]QQP85263.1 isoprenoid biosynthesis glyoxalase ElbB [Entomomonas asaccharolytica]